MSATSALSNDNLVLPNYEYEVIGTLSQSDIDEVFSFVKTDVETCPTDLVPPDGDWDAIAYARKANEELNPKTKFPFIIRSITQSNDTISVKIENLYSPHSWREGKDYVLRKKNGIFVIISKFTWLEDDIPDP